MEPELSAIHERVGANQHEPDYGQWTAVYLPTGETVVVIEKHAGPDANQPFFTVRMPDGAERQTVAERLELKPVRSRYRPRRARAHSAGSMVPVTSRSSYFSLPVWWC